MSRWNVNLIGYDDVLYSVLGAHVLSSHPPQSLLLLFTASSVAPPTAGV